ncbi:hypothetical protein [Paraburkholderia sp. CI3]|uniref:hypothetical protein n=1 Tax=Paraburkholderia sp. CI3 TaxID=2991060 RepID=UPI003D1D2C7C
MSEERTEEEPRYPNRGVLRFDRLREDGEILHPYSIRRDESVEWFIRVLLLFPRTYPEIRERGSIALPRATEANTTL